MEPPYDVQKWKLNAYRDKLRHSLSARFFLRFHVSLILLFTILFGWLTDIALLNIGITSMMVRYPLAIIAAYGVFLLGVYCWIEYSGIRQYIKFRRVPELVGDDVPMKPQDSLVGPRGWELLDPSVMFLGGEGCFIWFGLIFAAFFLYLFFGGYLLTGAASFFAEIVLELLLAAGLLRGVRRYESSGWISGVMNYTFWSLIFTITVAVLIGFFVHKSWPNAHTLPEGWAEQHALKKSPKNEIPKSVQPLPQR